MEKKYGVWKKWNLELNITDSLSKQCSSEFTSVKHKLSAA